MLTFPRFHGRVLLEARIAERQSPLGSMWKAWRIYFQLSPFNSTGLLNPRSCVRTVIATDPFFSLTPSLPLPPLSLLSPSDIDACVSCLFIYSPPSVSRARVFSPYFLFPVNETLSPAITGCLSGSPFAIKRPGRREEGEGSHEKEEEEKGEKRERNLVETSRVY